MAGRFGRREWDRSVVVIDRLAELGAARMPLSRALGGGGARNRLDTLARVAKGGLQGRSDRGEVELGRMFVWDAGALVDDGPRYIINFPTKKHWRSKSRLSDIRSGLDDLVRQLKDLEVKSVAVPPLGCGHGGLRWDEVRPLIEHAFSAVPDVTVAHLSA